MQLFASALTEHCIQNPATSTLNYAYLSIDRLLYFRIPEYFAPYIETKFWFSALKSLTILTLYLSWSCPNFPTMKNDNLVKLKMLSPYGISHTAIVMASCKTPIETTYNKLSNCIILKQKLENLAVYCCASDGGVGKEWGVFSGCYSTNPLPSKILWRSVEKCQRYPRSRICAPRKSGPKFTKNF